MLTTSTNPPNLCLKPFQPLSLINNFSLLTKAPTSSPLKSNLCHHLHRHHQHRTFVVQSSSDGGTADPSTQLPNFFGGRSWNSSASNVESLIRMLGLDNDQLDRERAIFALWMYSQGGKTCIDAIMQYRGCINLTVNLLRSESSSTCEAAAGLLRTISSIDVYINLVAESGAIEEITGILSRSPVTQEVKEQSIGTLRNLSIDEKLSVKMANSELLPALIRFLGDEGLKVKEAAAGVLANLATRQSNHKIMVEAGVIPKLAKVLEIEGKGSTVIREVAKNALLELSKDEFYRSIVMEEGLVLVPLVGRDAYMSFSPTSRHSRPSLPDGSELETSSTPSRYGASELLVGLNKQGKKNELEEAKVNAMTGRLNQEFLIRMEIMEVEDGTPRSESLMRQEYTLLHWIDGVARLVIILELEDVSAISRAALSIADASINEHMRKSFMVAGAVKHLVRLLNHNNENVKLAVCRALERLSLSNDVCNVIAAEGAVYPLVNAIKCEVMKESLMEKTVNILARILDPGKEMKLKFYDTPVNGSTKSFSPTRSSDASTGLGRKQDDMKQSEATTREYVLDSGLISRLVEIMKTSPSLQSKTAAILEYIATFEPSTDALIAADIESGLDAVFHLRFNHDMEGDRESQQPELAALEAAESGLAVSAASRLLTKLLDIKKFRDSINSTHMTESLRKVLMSNIPLQNKDWVAACLIKMESSFGSLLNPENPINKEVTLYETIPRLIEHIRTSSSPEAQEASVVELNAIISTGVADFTRAVADQGGIFPLVKVIEEGSMTAVEAGLAILFNLSMDSENHLAIIAAGAVPALRRIVLLEGPQWMRALRLLRSLPT